jgi:hypothetical protein
MNESQSPGSPMTAETSETAWISPPFPVQNDPDPIHLIRLDPATDSLVDEEATGMDWVEAIGHSRKKYSNIDATWLRLPRFSVSY